MTGWFVQRNELHIVTLDPFAKVGDLGQGDDGMAVAVGRHVVDQVDDAVFQAAGIETVHDVGDERPRVIHVQRASRVVASSCWICGPAAAAKALSLSDEFSGGCVKHYHGRVVSLPAQTGEGSQQLGLDIAGGQAAIDPVPLPDDEARFDSVFLAQDFGRS